MMIGTNTAAVLLMVISLANYSAGGMRKCVMPSSAEHMHGIT